MAHRVLKVSRQVGSYTYEMAQDMAYESKTREEALNLFRATYEAMQTTLDECIAGLAAKNDLDHASDFKRPASNGNYPAGVTFDPNSPAYEVISIDVTIAKGKRYIKVQTDKVKDYGFAVWPDFPEKNQWQLVSHATGIDLEHCDPKVYALAADQRFGIRLGKVKQGGKEISKIMQYVWKG